MIDKTAVVVETIKQLTFLEDLNNPQKLDTITNLLIVQLQSIADFVISKKKAIYRKVVRWWSKEVTDAVVNTKRAQQAFLSMLSQAIWG